MAHNSTELAVLIGSRLCHDLISPIGAIQNGLELISLSGSTPSTPELQLIDDSCNHATARIRLFRVAFGLAGTEQKLSASDLARLLTDYTRGSRLRTEVDVEGDHDRPAVQRALLAVLCCETALPVGGEVRIGQSDTGWILIASGPRLAPDTVLFGVLTGGDAPDLASRRGCSSFYCTRSAPTSAFGLVWSMAKMPSA